MERLRQELVRNRLLRAMSAEDFERLSPNLREIETRLHQPLITPGEPIQHLYFPESGFASSTASGGGKRIEVGLIGFEGLVGASPILLGVDSTPYSQFVQAAGHMLVIDVAPFKQAVAASPSLRDLLLAFVHVLTIQVVQTAFSSAAFGLEVRLARWLLMCQDRIGGEELQLTHEFLAMMLGVQRTSVTLSLQILEGTGSIRARRGRITVRDRARLLELANSGYGLPEAEYRRLIERS